MSDRGPTTHRTLLQELIIFLVAVLVGSVSGVLARELLLRWLSAASAANAALALATTCTGATHARLAHGQPVRVLGPKVVVAAPLAYGVMRLVHLLLGT